MAEVVTLDKLKRHLGITGEGLDVRLLEVLNAAERACFNYMGFANLEAWYTEHGELEPSTVDAAIIIVAKNLLETDGQVPHISDTVKSLLRPYRALIAGV